jgi:hypothetical protein
MELPPTRFAVILYLAAHLHPALALQVRTCSFIRDGIHEKVQLVFDERQRLAGFTWDLSASPDKRCYLSAETFKETQSERYSGFGGCELMTWRQGNRQTLAVSNSSACHAYCTAGMGTQVLELPIAVNLSASRCSE